MKKVTREYKNTMMGSVRQHYGQPQQWWAYYLDVSLAQIKMAESADRSLPMAAVIKLAKLEALHANTIKNETAQLIAAGSLPPQPEANTRRSKLARQADKLSYQKYTAENKLAKMQAQYRQALNSLAMVHHLLPQVPDSEETVSEKLSLEILQRHAETQAESCGPDAQAFLQWKIDCCTYAVARAKELDTINLPRFP